MPDAPLRTALFLMADLLTEPTASALLERMRLASVPVFLVGETSDAATDPRIAGQVTAPVLRARDLLLLAKERHLDLGTSWVIARDDGLRGMLATAGLAGLVILDGQAPTEDDGLLIAHARDLADAPRVMLPRNGGCWHGH